MGLRQTLRQKPWLGMAFAVCLTCLALGAIVWQAFGGRSRSAVGTTTRFYSDDDGKTWFLDDMNRIPPFDHNGKQAVRATVFRCASSGFFVAYLQRFPEQEHARLEAALAKDPSMPAAQLLKLEFAAPMEAKKPGDQKWVSVSPGSPRGTAEEYRKVITPICPDGSADLVPVTPDDSNNGASN